MTEDRIIKFIKREYDPEVILLAGSRARGRETEKSDWDIFLLGSQKEGSGFIDFEGVRLDVTCKAWPEENKPLTIPYGPLWPVKILSDDSEGKLQKVLTKTEEDFMRGPLVLHTGGILGRFERLDSWRRKMEKYRNNPIVEFYYAGFFYEIAIRLWFEIRNRWPLTPSEGLPVIKEEDREFYELLVSFTSSGSSDRIKFTEILFNLLDTKRPEDK